MDLTEEEIKKGWQVYTEKLYKKYHHDLDDHNGVITHLEPDILECEVKWALGSTLAGSQFPQPAIRQGILTEHLLCAGARLWP